MIPYILNVTVITTICFLFYKLFLQKETFYQLNRWMLMGSMAIAFVLPLLPVPQQLTWQDIRVPLSQEAAPQPMAGSDLAPAPAPLASSTSAPVIVAPANARAGQLSAVPEKGDPVTVNRIVSFAAHWLFYVYLFGVLVFGINFLLQLSVLLYRSYANPVIWDGRFRIVETGGNRAPCSFGNTIFINPVAYDWETYNQILIHEKTHVSGRHTVDILLAEIAVVWQWFNPIAWWYRREVENNLEFLTDESVLLHEEVDRAAYQLSLLRVSVRHLPFSITNNYNQSLLKRRIVMMNSKRSSRHTVWKYFFLLPVFTALVCVLNKPAVYGQLSKPASYKSAKKATPAPASDPVTASVSVSGGGASLGTGSSTAAMAPLMAVSTLPAVSVHTNVSLSDLSVNGDADTSVHNLTEGSWLITIMDGKLWVELKAEQDDYSWSHSMTFEKADISPFPGMGNVTFKMVREAGTMTFAGQFDGSQGFGHFHFQADETYFNAMTKMGVEELDSRQQIGFFLSNIKKDYASMVLTNGYPHIRGRELASLSVLHIDEEFIQYWRAAGLAGVDEPRTLITLKAQNIDKSYVEELKAAGYDNLTARELVTLKAQHINGAYVRSMGRKKDNEAIPVRELVSYKAMNIDSAYLTSLRKLGYTDLEPREVTSLYAMHVTADFIKEFQELGYKDIPVRELLTLKSMEITPGYVKAFRDIGYDNVPASRLGSLKAVGVTPEFVGEFKKLGFDNIPMNMLSSLKTMGVNAEYITKMREKGFISKDLNKYIRLKNDFN